MADEQPKATGVEVSDEELRESFTLPAINSNRMLATNLPSGLRVAFMEQYGAQVPARLRAAVILSYPDAVALRNLLSRQLKDFEAVQALEIEIGPDGKPIVKQHGA
jgi:hypothetical protein